MRDPRPLPKPRTKPPSSIDTNPGEPSDQQNQQQLRRRRRVTSSSSLDFSATASDQSQLYVEKKQATKRVKEMCTNEYLRGIGVTPHPYSTDP